MRLIACCDLDFVQQQRKINSEKFRGILKNKPILSPTGDTFFIIGTGPSINTMTEDNWKLIAQARFW